MLQFALTALILVALLIPITAILVDSPVGRSLARRMEGQGGGGTGAALDLQALQRKVELLEGEVEELTRSLAATREEMQFVQRLLEKPKSQPPA